MVENILALLSLIFAKPMAFDVNSLCLTHLNKWCCEKTQSIIDEHHLVLLLDKHLSQFLWVEVVCAACIILNLWSIKWTPYKTLKKFFSKGKPFIVDLQVFGSTIYIHPNKRNPSKLAPRSKFLHFTKSRHPCEWVLMLPTLYSLLHHLPQCLDHWDKWCDSWQINPIGPY